MVDAWNNVAFNDEKYQARYNENRDEFCFCDGGLEGWDCCKVQTIGFGGKTIKVYPIGTFCWTWSSPFAKSTSHILNFKLLVKRYTQPQPLQDIPDSPGFSGKTPDH